MKRIMSKKPRWHENLVSSKGNTAAQKAGGKEPAASASGGGKPPFKSGVSCVRSNSLGSSSSSSRGGLDSSVRAGGSLKRSTGQQNLCVQSGSRAASRSVRPTLRLCSSRSFSSLHTSSLTNAPFIRSSRSLSRLDHRPYSDHTGSPAKKGKNGENKPLTSGQLSSAHRDHRDGEDVEKMRKCPSESAESSSLVSASECPHHCNKIKKQGRDGVSTFCAMTSGMRRNLVQAVLKNVRPTSMPELTSPLSEPRPPSHPPDDLQETEPTYSFTPDCAEETQKQHRDQEPKRQSAADRNSESSSIIIPVSPTDSPALSLVGTSQQEEEGGGESASCCLGEGSTSGAECDASISTTMQSNTKCVGEKLRTEGDTNQENSTTKSEEQHKPMDEQKTGQLVKEIELTQKEMSQLQQINKNLQEELQHWKESHTALKVDSLSNGPLDQTLALQGMQKMNHDLRFELEALKRSQEEAKEAELRRRVDLLAQQAQLLVTGDATALAQAHLEQDRRRFQEQRTEWERCVASLKSQLSAVEEQKKEAEEQRKEADSRFTKLQQEVQGYHSLQEEAEHLQRSLQEMKTLLEANQEAQAQKEARLQKHLLLLQASQDRERRSLSASLAQAEQHSQDLQDRLDRAEEQLGSFSQSQTWTKQIEQAQQQLQEELAETISAVQKLQEERDQLEHRCEELQSQLSEADGELSRLQNRLKTDETHYYNLEHSYESVCEELQVALGTVKQKEADTQDIREGYERLLDEKEQELTEVLLKMEVLGNSLEETEVKLNEMIKVSPPSQKRDESTEMDGGLWSGGSDSAQHSRPRSCTVDSSQQCDSTSGDDQERFMAVIQTLEAKLFATEEKLRDIMQRLEDHQGHTGCQDPHLCSQLTRSRATIQHLSLLLHSQAKQSQRFAQETESRCMMLVGRFQVALNIIQVCRERLQSTPINVTEFERQLSSAAACLQQGEKDAQKQLLESRNAGRGDDRILSDGASDGAKRRPAEDESVGKCLRRELFVVEKMISVLQSQHGQILLGPRDDEGDFAGRYRSLISQRIALKKGRRTQFGRAECNNVNEPLESIIQRVCVEAELIYAALKLLQEYESEMDESNDEPEPERKSLSEFNPPELAPYEGKGLEETGSEIDESGDRKEDWLERLVSRLQRRAKCLQQLCQETSDRDGADCSMDDWWENASAADVLWMQEQVKLIYLSERLFLDVDQQSEVLKEKLQALGKEDEITLKDEAFNHTLCQLQEDNSALKKELERAEMKIISVEGGNQRLMENMQEIEDFHEEQMNKLEADFQEKIKELQQIHEEEMKHLHGYYTKCSLFKEKQIKTSTDSSAPAENNSPSSDQTGRKTIEEIRKQTMGDDKTARREAYQEDHETLEVPCDESLTALEELHKQLIGDLQQKHQQEVTALLKEKDQLLQEETAATMAAIVAMRRAHKQELERSRRSQQIKESEDITQLQIEHDKELSALQKELEALSVQHTQKCLENSQLSQELQEEKQTSMEYQKENQELKKKQRETNEITQRSSSLNGKQPLVVPPENDFYEMEVILRAREAEMQFLRQEARSLRDELKAARMDKLYAQNKLKALYTNSTEDNNHDVGEEFRFSSSDRDVSAQSHDDALTDASNAAFLRKTQNSSLTRQIRGLRSWSLKEGLSVQEKLKLFESF